MSNDDQDMIGAQEPSMRGDQVLIMRGGHENEQDRWALGHGIHVFYTLKTFLITSLQMKFSLE